MKVSSLVLFGTIYFLQTFKSRVIFMCIAALPAIAAIGQAVVGYAGANAEAGAPNAYHNQNRVNAIGAANGSALNPGRSSNS